LREETRHDLQGDLVTVKRMDNVGIVVEDLDDAVEFFTELGLRLEGRTMVEGEWAGRITGLGTQRVEIAMRVAVCRRSVHDVSQ
jgi:hypothetical protein